MPQVNPLITTPEEQFVVGESDFAFFGNYACRVEGGAILFCRSGSADATVNQYQGQVRRNTMVLLLPGSIFMLTDRTEDFRAAYCSFSRDLFSEAAFRMDPSFFHALRERPISHPPQRIVEGASIWLQMAAYTYRDRGNVFRNTIIKNRLQNLLLESYDKMQRFAARQHRVPETTTRQSELFHRFVALVHEHCAQEREVSFYADKLCISTRYLSTIVRSVAHSSAKEFIDRYDKMQRFAARQHRVPETTTRQSELFHRFVALVHEHCAQEREVSFYADKLCISTRYLSTIVRSVAHSSAKEFIDRSVMLEIKMMLQSTDLSVQEIAYRLRFPDQSYLGRFFKKHAGESPTEYRNNKK